MKIIIIVTLLLIVKLQIFAQGIKGIITDESKQPVPFAAVYVEGSPSGTTSNLLGEYQLVLKPGNYKILFRSLGYKQVLKEVIIDNTMQELNITLPAEVYQLSEVTISRKGEDPAYAIMRKAIAWAPYHLMQVKHYKSSVYLKGNFFIEKVPFFLRQSVDIGSTKVKFKGGQTFVIESVNEIKFDAPHKYVQTVKSSRSSLPNNTGKVDVVMGMIQSSFYESNPEGYISPLSPQAFQHYTFAYEGAFEEGKHVINKIKVTPKRKSQKLFTGHIFIVDQYWGLHSVDLTTNEFWGTLRQKQLFYPIKGEAWLPLTYNMFVDASYMGVKGQYKYTSSVTYTDVLVDEKRAGPVALKNEYETAEKQSASAQKKQADLEALLAKENLTNRDVRKIVRESRKEEKRRTTDTIKSLEIPRSFIIDPGAAKLDTSYWSQVRSVPLTNDEQKSYHKRDSIITVIKAKTGNDTLQKKPGRKLTSKILRGFREHSKDSTVWWGNDGLLKLGNIAFNTVDGWSYRQSGYVNIKLDSMHNLIIAPGVKYAFNRKALMGNLSVEYSFAPERNGNVNFSIGNQSTDFNRYRGINEMLNTASSLFFRRNYVKLFDNRYTTLGYAIDLSNGLRLNTRINFMEAKTLNNHSDYSFFFQKERNYTPNIPDNAFFQSEPDHFKSFTFAAGLTYTPEYYYKIRQHRKIYDHSKYPTFTLNYKAGIHALLGSQSSYQFFSGGIRQQVKFPDESSLSYSIESGTFMNDDHLHFSEFKHFNTQPLPVMFKGTDSPFLLLDFYRYSTSKAYLEGHVHYETPLLLLKRLPIISNRLWTENIYLNYLNAQSLKNYMEAGYGLGNFLFMADISVFASFENFKSKDVGVKISIGLGD
jgi:hypothetical protein